MTTKMGLPKSIDLSSFFELLEKPHITMAMTIVGETKRNAN